jgi:hypothetical protein
MALYPLIHKIAKYSVYETRNSKFPNTIFSFYSSYKR